MSNLRTWNVAKLNKHDISGVSNPEKWMYQIVDGVFIPVMEIVEPVEEVDEMFDKLDPDMSDEEIEGLGYEIKFSKLIGEDIVDYREGCGHAVIGLN